MALVSDESLVSSLHLSRWTLGLAKRLLAIPRLNDLGRDCVGRAGPDFAAGLLRALKIELLVEPDGRASLPSDPVVVLSNHPFGLLDGLILIKLIGEGGGRLKILANYLLGGVSQLEDQLVFVNAFDASGDGRSNIGNVRQAMRLAQSASIIMFPSGDVSTFRLGRMRVADRPWTTASAKLVKKLNLPIVPVYIEGRNSLTYQLMNGLHAKLGLLRLPRELLNKRGRIIRVAIGEPAPLTAEERRAPAASLSKMLQSRVEALGAEPVRPGRSVAS